MTDKIKIKRIKPDLPGGFRDYAPADAIARQNMLDTIRRTFESFGFDPLETSAVQRTEVLTGGEEDSGKIIFDVRGSRARDPRDDGDDESGMALRFDLTVPLARFVAANPDIPKPFKRYQIGTVWRGERQQAGRYREFTQADVDIVGSSALGTESEIALLIYTCFNNLGIENFVINYNNRKILDALPQYAGFSEEKLWKVLRTIDKCDKIGREGVKKEIEKEFGAEVAERIQEFIFGNPERDNTDWTNDDRYAEICKTFKALDIDYKKFIVFNRSLVRGLSYYTGSVFEVILSDAPEMGSVCGGGRYDDLVAKFTGQNIPAIGVSIGVDRLFVAMEKLVKSSQKKTKTQVLILQIGAYWRQEYFAMAQELRSVGINTDLYLGDGQMFQAQLDYALKKEIPYVVMYGEDEEKRGVVAIKNLQTREQKEMPKEKIVEYLVGEVRPL